MTHVREDEFFGDAGDALLERSFGSRRLIRALTGRPGVRRYLADDRRRGVDCLVCVLDGVPERSRQAAWAYLEQAVEHRRPHVLRLDAAGRERGGLLWVSASYPGNQDDVVTLEALCRARGGAFSEHETARTVEQILSGVERSHAEGDVHGPLSMDEILVTSRGQIEIELYGLGRHLRNEGGERADDESRDEVRSVAAIAWRMLSGLPAESFDVYAGRSQAARALDRRWLGWIRRGLDPVGGFATASEAVDALPSMGGSGVPAPVIDVDRGLLERLSSAVSSRRANAFPWARKKPGGGGVS